MFELSFLTNGGADGMTYDSRSQTLIVRTDFEQNFIEKYDQLGNHLGSVGKGVDEAVGLMGVAMDTKREMYILPTSAGDLVTMDTEGNVKDTIKVIDAPLHGISTVTMEISTSPVVLGGNTEERIKFM